MGAPQLIVIVPVGRDGRRKLDLEPGTHCCAIRPRLGPENVRAGAEKFSKLAVTGFD